MSVFFVVFILRFDNAHAERVKKNNINENLVHKDRVDGVSESTLRDPTKPLFRVKKKTIVSEPLALQAVFFRRNNRSAVINGKHVNVGDVVSNYKVLSIGERVVRLGKDNKKVTLSLRGGMRNVRP